MILPGDTLILDCYYKSTERNVTTTGGQSTRHEMCFDFYFYYPAVDLLSASSAKTEEALGKWMVDAQANGYLTGDILGAADNGLDSLYYDHTMDGSLEFYNRLWDPEYTEYDQNYVYCQGDGNDSTILYEIGTQPTGFVEYDQDVFTCDKPTTTTVTSTDDTDSKAMSILEHIWFTIVLGLFRFMIM